MNSQRNRSIILWLAALAILWGMLAPTIASTFAPNPAHQGKTWIEVCMSAGTRLIALDPGGVGDDAGKDKAVHPGMHCPACVSQYDLAVVAHPPGTLMLLDAPVERILRLHGPTLPPAAAIHAAHRSRAPPLPA